MVKMLDGMTDEQRAALIRKLARENPLLAFRLQQRHFGFADLQYADDGGLDRLLNSFETDAWLEALYGTPDALFRTFVNRMGADAGRKFVLASQAMASPSARTTEAARKAILIKAYILRDQGHLTVSIPGMKSDFV